MVSNIIPETEKVIYEFVKFENVLINYDVSQNFEVEFTLDSSVKGSSKDWIGIFHAGWNSYESFLTHEYVFGMPCDETGRRRKVKFLSKHVQHANPGVPYQFVYVNKYLEIMGVSQYFQFTVNFQKKDLSLLDDTMCEGSFSPNQESSPVKDCNPNITYKEKMEHRNRNTLNDSLALPHTELYTNCKLYSISKWKDSCTYCYQCRDVFQMMASRDELLEKVKQYQDYNCVLQNRVHRLEKWLEWEENKKKSDFNTCMFHLTEAVGSAIRSSVFGQGDNKGIFSQGCFDWDFSSKELYLKAVIGQQELTIRDLNKVICELGYIDQPKVCCRPSVSFQDTVKISKTEERTVAEIYDIINTSEEEL